MYFKNSDVSKSNKIKIPVNFTITDGTSDTYIEYLFTTLPKFHETLTYTGSDLTLTSTAPVLKSAEELAQLNVKNNIISWWFVDKNGISLKEGILPTAINPGVYRYTFKVEYLNSINDNTYILTGADYYTTILKDIGHSDITYNARCSDYQSLDEDIFLTQFYTVKDKEKDLEILEQYEVSFSPDAEYYETGTDITLTYKGITNAGLDTLEDSRSLYTGTVTKKIPVSTIDVKLNGAAQVSKYDDAVVFTAEGYTISDSATGTFDTEYTYSTPCDNIDLPLYFKKNGRVVKQTIKGLTIGNAAGIRLLYDGSSELKPLYHDSVRISADGYTVSATQTGTFSDNYVLSYDASKNMTPVDTFSLYFKDKSTGGVYQKNISGINLAETPGTVTVLYNGASQKEWYNANVTITGTEAGTTNKCTISDSKDGTYTSNYVMTGSGLVSKKLYFKNSAGTVLNDGNPYTIVVNIDKTAPTGTITLNGATSSSFKSTDSTVGYANSSQKASISASDDVSGVETIKYYASETFYSSSSDLIAGMSEKSGAWRTYSSSSAPQLVKDKNNYIYVAITDKAGNTGYISLGSIIYDTVAPTVTTATVTDSADGKSKVLVIAGTDELSGINRFKLMYFEKDNTHQPSKDEIFNMGTYISASASSGKEAGATYTIEGLESGKTYVFYVASVDRAGNISDVKAIEGEGTTAAEAAAAKAAADAAAAQAAASSALAAAPNGLAGGNSGQPTTSPEASANSQSGTSGEEEGEEERVISRDPYIAEATGSTQIGPINTSGWDKIKGEIRKADNGTQMSVEMSGVSEIPLSVLKEVADRDDLEVTFLINDGVEWTIKGSSITEEGIKTVDLGVKMGSKNIPAKVSNDVVGSYQHVDFAVNEEGELGFTATISVPVGTSNAGMNATLYYYNPKKNELEAQKASIVDDNGRAKFDMTHCSDYTIVITPEKLLSDSEVSYSVTRSDTLTSEEIFDGTKIRLADLFGVSGGGRIWLFVIAAISAALCVAILYFPGLQKEEGN
ncbi:MAG: hypothetical protein J6O03_07645 [Butyrivibrio sp.]|nr:hypothetical protein [Butyrivibrio sp.]